MSPPALNPRWLVETWLVTALPNVAVSNGYEDAIVTSLTTSCPTMIHDGPAERAIDHRGVAGNSHTACRCSAVSSWPSCESSPPTLRGLLKNNGCGICALTDPDESL